MAQDAELASCNDALTGERAISRIARDTCIEFGATLDNWQARVRLFWPFLCGAELLIGRYRSECFQLAEPEWMESADFGDCPGLAGMPHGLTNYADDGWRCYRCGAQPFWPLHECAPADKRQTTAERLVARWIEKHSLDDTLGTDFPCLCTRWPVSEWWQRKYPGEYRKIAEVIAGVRQECWQP